MKACSTILQIRVNLNIGGVELVIFQLDGFFNFEVREVRDLYELRFYENYICTVIKIKFKPR